MNLEFVTSIRTQLWLIHVRSIRHRRCHSVILGSVPSYRMRPPLPYTGGLIVDIPRKRRLVGGGSGTVLGHHADVDILIIQEIVHDLQTLLLLILLLVLCGLHAACYPQAGDSGSLLRLELDALLLKVQLVLIVWNGFGRFALLLGLVHCCIFALLLLVLQVIFGR